MAESYGRPRGGASAWDASRALAAAGGQATSPGAESLEAAPVPVTPARVESAVALEGGSVTACAATIKPVAGCRAFLDGIQRTLLIGHAGGVLPVVHGTIAAAVRVRTDRTPAVWPPGPIVDRAIYLPRGDVDRSLIAALELGGFDVRDTLAADDRAAELHPADLASRARVAVQRTRERAEATLADRWAAEGDGVLYVDGGIAGFAAASRSARVVGVIKSHHTLYAGPSGAALLAGLDVAQRTTAFRVSTRGRTAVASWYLRLRRTGDPLGGLVRIEIAESSFATARADEVSAWILAEREPLALPDPRWPVMAYAIRECEEYLRAVAG